MSFSGGSGGQQPNLNRQQLQNDLLMNQLQQQQPQQVPLAAMQTAASSQHAPNARLLSASVLQQYQNQQMVATARFLQQTLQLQHQAQQQQQQNVGGISGPDGNLSDVQKLLQPALLSIFQQAQRMQLNTTGTSLENSTSNIPAVLSTSQSLMNVTPAATTTASHVAAVPNFVPGNPNKPSSTILKTNTLGSTAPPMQPQSVTPTKSLGAASGSLPTPSQSPRSTISHANINAYLNSHAKAKPTVDTKKSTTNAQLLPLSQKLVIDAVDKPIVSPSIISTGIDMTPPEISIRASTPTHTPQKPKTSSLQSKDTKLTVPLSIETPSSTTPVKAASPKASSPRTKQTPRKNSNPLKASGILASTDVTPAVKIPAKVTPPTNIAKLVTPIDIVATPSNPTTLSITSKPDKSNIPIVSPASSATKISSAAISPQIPKELSKSTSNVNNKAASPKRHRAKTILYQSPTPELTLVTKLLSVSKANASQKSIEDRLILFYKHEFLAVRNADRGFFLCQTMHNVYKSSPRIRILWLSEIEGKTDKYKLDFYDTTDIECVLTSLELSRLDKNNFFLSSPERERIENILKKAIDVETGAVPRPTVTEENPDGLDLSLYKNESQIEKKLNSTGGSKTTKRKSTEPVTPKPSASRRFIVSSRSSSVTPLSARTKKGVGRKAVKADSEDDDDEDYRPASKKVPSNTPVLTKTSKPEMSESSASGRANAETTNKTTINAGKTNCIDPNLTNDKKQPVNKRAPIDKKKTLSEEAAASESDDSDDAPLAKKSNKLKTTTAATVTLTPSAQKKRKLNSVK